jgi:DNA-binding transcriptional ArsR family regulator
MYIEHDRTRRFDVHQTYLRREDVMASTLESEERTLPAVQPVGTLHQVLAALADPVRLEMVRRLAEAGEPIACAQLYVGINKSTASHHFKILREAGLTERVVIGGQTHQLLRSREVDDALPGVLPSVVAAARG